MKGSPLNDTKYVGSDTVPHEGLYNKFPFDAQKKTYKIWDTVTKMGVDATYVGSEKLDGLEVYKYHVDVSADNAEILPDIQGSYTDDSTYYVEPKTGAIVNRVDKQQRLIDGKSLVLQLDIRLTDKALADKIHDTKSDISHLRLATLILPIIAYVLGLLFLVGGILLTRRSNT